jgi:broad specificity phosphatase PhoE
MADKTTRLYLIRHGETLANQKHLLQGASDGELTDEGRSQIEQLGRHMAHFQIDKIISSDLTRAYLTGAAIAKHLGLEVEISPLVREWDCGVWDGRTQKEFLEMIEQLDGGIATFEPEGGETMAQVQQRASDFLAKILSEDRGKTIAVCSHGDFIRMLLSCMLEIHSNQASLFFFDNASYSLFEHDGKRWRAIFINRLPSLEREKIS